MDKSLKRVTNLTFVLVVVLGSFVWGRLLGAETAAHHHALPRYLASLISGRHSTLLADATNPQDGDSLVPPIDVYETILDHVQREYVYGVDSQAKLSNGALSQMLSSLGDPKTYFLDPHMREARQNALEGKFDGVGAVFATTRVKKDDVDYVYLTVVDVMPGSPADTAGLKTGDRVTDVDGHWVIAYSPQVDIVRIIKAKMDEQKEQEEFNKLTDKFRKGYAISKVIPMLESGSGKAIAVTVDRGGTPVAVNMTTAVTAVSPVDYSVLKGKVGYLKIRQFNPHASEQLQSAFSKITPSLKGLIVDLRGNPGGVKADAGTGADGYASAVKLIGQLTHGGTVAMVEHHPNSREPLLVKTNASAPSIPIVVLVDSGTANLAELVASALHDTAKAKIIGARTFGDSMLQFFTVLKNGAGLEMSTAKLLTAGGTDLASGIQPDVPVAPAAAGTDAALHSALTTLGVGA